MGILYFSLKLPLSVVILVSTDLYFKMTTGHVQVKTRVIGICLYHFGFIDIKQLNVSSYIPYPSPTFKNIKPSSPDIGEMGGIA